MSDTIRPISAATLDTLNDVATTATMAADAGREGSKDRCIHLLRQAAELIANALSDFDPDLITSVRITTSGFDSSAEAFTPEETPTDIDHEIPSRTGALMCPERVDRYELLHLAGAAIGREAQYGPATANFLHVAEMWSAILGITVTTERVMLCMAGLKMARLIYNPSHVDSWADLAGYAALGAELGTLPAVDEPAGAA